MVRQRELRGELTGDLRSTLFSYEFEYPLLGSYSKYGFKLESYVYGSDKKQVDKVVSEAFLCDLTVI